MRILVLLGALALACTPAGPDASRQDPLATTPPTAPTTNAPTVTGRVVAFERIGRAPPGGFSPIDARTAGGPTAVVATSAEEMSALLANERVATHVTGLPPIADGVYVAAFAGVKPSSGYGIAVTDARAEAGALTLWVRQTTPSADATVLGTLTYPVDVIRIDRGEISTGARVTLRDAVTGVRLTTTTYCGSTRQITPLTPYDPKGPECVWDAYSRGDTAQWLTRTLTTEGGPIIRTLRAVPGGLSEASLDDRGDGFASRPGVRSWACAQIARSTANAFSSGQLLVWFSLSQCTGNGYEAEVG